MIEINNNFKEQVLDNEGITIVDFFAVWCGPCKIFSPIFEKVSNKFENIKFCKLDVDKNRLIAKQYGVMSIPTIIIFENGKEIKRKTGFLSEEDFINFIK